MSKVIRLSTVAARRLDALKQPGESNNDALTRIMAANDAAEAMSNRELGSVNLNHRYGPLIDVIDNGFTQIGEPLSVSQFEFLQGSLQAVCTIIETIGMDQVLRNIREGGK